MAQYLWELNSIDLKHQLLDLRWTCPKQCGREIRKQIQRPNGQNWVVDRQFIYFVKKHIWECGKEENNES